MRRKHLSRSLHLAEPLEPRRLLAVVNGTMGPDEILVSQTATNVVVNRNGITLFFPLESLTISGGLGADTITIFKYNVPGGLLVIDGGPDADTITVGNGDMSVNMPPPGELTVPQASILGGGGNDTIIIDDRNSAASSYDLNGEFALSTTHGTSFRAFGLEFQGRKLFTLDIETVRLDCNGQGNTISIDPDYNGVDLYDINGLGGDDRCFFGSINSGPNFGIVDFNGGTGTANEFSYGELGAGTVRVEANDVFLGASATSAGHWTSTQIVRVLVDALNVNGQNTFHINTVPAGVSLTVGSADGADTYNVAAGDVDAAILGTLTIIDTQSVLAGGLDHVIFHDTTGTTGDSYTIASLSATEQSFTKTGLANAITIRAVEQITLNANGGNNNISVSATDADVMIDAGPGNDTVSYGGGTLVGGGSTLVGGAGTDSLTYADTSGIVAGVLDKDYSLAGGVLTYNYQQTAGPVQRLHQYSFEALSINSGAYDSQFAVSSLGIETSLNINAGGGGDELLLMPFSTAATINFNAQTGNDRVTIDDSGDTGNDTYFLTSSTFDKTGFGSLTFGGIEAISVTANPSANTVNVLSLAAAMPTTVSGGSGNDTFFVGDDDTDSNIFSPLLINGDAGSDALFITDQNDTGNDGYLINFDAYSKTSGGGVIRFATVETVDVNANPADNVFTVPVVASDVTTLRLRGGVGNDSFNLTPSSAALSIDGGASTASGDVITFTNAASGGAATFTPSVAGSGTYGFFAAQDIVIFAMESFPTPPTTTPSVPALLPAHDTGISNSDGITNRTNPTFTGTAGASATVLLVSNGGTTAYGSGTASVGGEFSVVGTFPADGNYSVSAAVQGASGLVGPLSPITNVTIDTVAPAAPTVAPDLTAASDTGISNSDNITRIRVPTFTGTGLPGTLVRLLANGSAVGSQFLSVIQLSYAITSSSLTDGVKQMAVRHEDIAGNLSGAGPTLAVTIDTVAPTISVASFAFLTSNSLNYTFSEDVSSTLSVADVKVRNITTSADVAAGSIALANTPPKASFTFPGLANATLPDGDYTGTLLSAGVTDVAGNPLPADHVHPFFFLNGDANRDRIVDIGDFAILAGRFNLPGTFSQANFDYTGNVDIGDFAILASKFNTSLVPPSGLRTQSPTQGQTSLPAPEPTARDGEQSPLSAWDEGSLEEQDTPLV